MDSTLLGDSTLYIFSSVTAIAAVALLVAAIRSVINRKTLRALSCTTVAALLLAASAVAVAILAHVYTYQRLTHERLVADIVIERLGHQHYKVRLLTAPTQQRIYDLKGDQWQLDARILKWHGWANVLGLDTLYRLERLSSRYSDVQQARNVPHDAHALSRRGGIDLWQLAQKYGSWLPGIDARYGNATYMPLGNGARYSVYITSSGLITRPANAIAKALVESWS